MPGNSGSVSSRPYSTGVSLQGSIFSIFAFTTCILVRTRLAISFSNENCKISLPIYEDENFRNTARQRLIDKLREHAGKRIMLIGHSMGSIIAYDVLRIIGRETPPVPGDHFVTIGSPLGLPHVKTKIYQENDLVRTPSVVGRWTNFADRRDVVAVEAKLGDDYEANDQEVKVADVPVINGYKSPRLIAFRQTNRTFTSPTATYAHPNCRMWYEGSFDSPWTLSKGFCSFSRTRRERIVGRGGERTPPDINP
jgi:pimeloyl-ACP methyl ester carboxylesterase